ncbi:hypothetical protein Bhyg_17634, partial [Pseudolycoriella hygida]
CHLERLGPRNELIPLSIGANTVGRLSTNKIVLNSKYVSRSHCTIIVTEINRVTLKNVTTTNGVFINGKQKVSKNIEMHLKIGDVFGIGCDTTIDEIKDEECFIFRVKRGKSEIKEADEVILLDESDEEEECKILEEYSQLNLSEMKQEYMELEDMVEEYSRSNFIKEEADEMIQIDPPAMAGQFCTKVVDVFDEVIPGSGKNDDDKKLVQNILPDVALVPKKDCAVDADTLVPSTNLNKHESTEKTERGERRSRRKKTETESTGLSNLRKVRKISISDDVSPLPPLIKECRVEIRLKKLATEVSPKHKKEVTKASASEVKGSVQSNITKRRNTFVPSSTLSSGNTKKSVEVIDAPHMLKRRKSICVTSDELKSARKTKEAKFKWLSKEVPSKQTHKRSKEEQEEIKLKLAALVPDPKDKVVLPKIPRTNTKIPVKNTHKSRSDQLTETIVTTINTTGTKHKTNESAVMPDVCKRRRMSITLKKDEPKFTVAKPEMKRNAEYECAVNGSDNVSKNKSIANDFEANATISLQATTSPVLKSILKKSAPIQKRRITVSFVEEPRIKTIPRVKEKVAKIDKVDEENSDDVIYNIMALGISSLKQPSAATINGKNFAYKTVANEYASCKQLQNVFIPLMKAELWKEIEDGYALAKNKPATNIQMNYCLRDDLNPNRFKYHCE